MISLSVSIRCKRWIYYWVLIWTIIRALRGLAWITHHWTLRRWDYSIWSEMIYWWAISIVSRRLVFIKHSALVKWRADTSIGWTHWATIVRIWWLKTTIWTLKSLARWKCSIIHRLISWCIFWSLTSTIHVWSVLSIFCAINTS